MPKRGQLGLDNGSGFLNGFPMLLCRGKLGLESVGFALQLGLPLLEVGLLKPQLPAILHDKGLANLCHLLVDLHHMPTLKRRGGGRRRDGAEARRRRGGG